MRKIVTILLAIIATEAKANTYFVSANGNDSLNGKTIATAWKTLNRVNIFKFSAGDSLLLKGGDIFPGAISITGNANEYKPFTISSFGVGKATISSGIITGISFLNAGDITITNVIVTGNGYKATKINIHGIEFHNDSLISSNIKTSQLITWKLMDMAAMVFILTRRIAAMVSVI